MSLITEVTWLNGLLELMRWAQLALLALWHGLGWSGDLYGQPAWPWAQRLSGDNLLLDLPQARRLAWSLLAAAASVLLLGLALLWRRRRGVCLLLALALPLFAPWPDAHVLWVPASPTSFHQAPGPARAESLLQAQRLYAQHCEACHAPDGSGEGRLAPTLAGWPPHFAGPLLWRRSDGDLLWSVLQGRHNRQGQLLMPAFAGVLTEAQAWALIDYLKLLGAGQARRLSGYWPNPVAIPDFALRCGAQPPRRLSRWAGQRLRLVAWAPGQPLPVEDPRLNTVLLTPPGQAAPHSGGFGDADVDCVAQGPEAWAALALLTGETPDRLAGYQWLSDRQGWARAQSTPGAGAWSDADLLCRTGGDALQAGASSASVAATAADGLGSLIARMDAEPVRFVKGGFVH